MAVIMIVEDDRELRETLKELLILKNYDVITAGSLKEFEEHTDIYDMYLLDVKLPDGDGFDICERIRHNSDAPIIFITSCYDEESIIKGLDMGGDDYVTKPFGMMELISRIKAVLRRSGKQQDKTKLSVGGISLDTKKHEVKVDGEQVVLTLKEFELLGKLMRNQGIVLTRDQLLTEIWGYDFDGETRTVDVHIRTLRQKLGEQGSLVKTVRGVGYRIGGEA